MIDEKRLGWHDFQRTGGGGAERAITSWMVSAADGGLDGSAAGRISRGRHAAATERSRRRLTDGVTCPDCRPIVADCRRIAASMHGSRSDMIADVRSRSDHHRRGTVGPLRRHRRQAARPRLPGHRAGRARQFDLSVFRRRWCSSRRRNCSRSAGCRSSRPYEKPTRVEALKLLPQGRRHVRSADRVRGDGALRRARAAAGRRTGRGGGGRCLSSKRARRAASTASATRGTSSSRSATTIAPNLLNVPGEDLPHVHHYYSEPHPYYRRRVVIVGGGNSAAESALEMFRAGAHVTLVHRTPELKNDHQVLGAAGHREPDQGRLDRRALQHAA